MPAGLLITSRCSSSKRMIKVSVPGISKRFSGTTIVWSLDRLLPNRHHSLHLVDQELASRKRLASMRRDDLDPKRRFVRLHYANAMHQANRFDGPALLDLAEDQFELMPDHFFKCLVFDSLNGALLLNSAHHSGKINGSAHRAGHGPPQHEFGFLNWQRC